MSISEEISKCIEILNQGGVILCPTDTIWGLSCDATNDIAIKKIFEIKKRHESKSLISLIENETKLHHYVKEIPDMAWDLIDISNSPLTIIYPEGKNISKLAISEDNSIAIRVVQKGFMNELLKKYKKPLTSTSPNISGEKTPSSFYDITNEILKAVDYVVNLQEEKNKKSSSSSIIKLGLNNEITIIRK